MIININQLDFTFSYMDYYMWKFENRAKLFKGKIFEIGPSPRTNHQQISENLAKEKSASNLVYNNENNEINSLFTLKNSLINEIAAQRINIENIKLYIKDISTTTNIINSKGINNKMKLILPFLYLFIYFIFYNFISLYKKQLTRVR